MNFYTFLYFWDKNDKTSFCTSKLKYGYYLALRDSKAFSMNWVGSKFCTEHFYIIFIYFLDIFTKFCLFFFRKNTTDS